MTEYLLKLLPEKPKNITKIANLICERCGNPFTVPFWMVKKGRRFCSHKCRKADPLKTLMRRIEKDKNGCWNYTGFCGWGGYGQIKVGSTNYTTHRLMWILWNKQKVPDGMVVRHTCIGNRKCINPDHLILGTQKDNIRDCIDQGRFAPVFTGEDRSNSKLTDDMVREIRASRIPGDGSKPESYRSISKRLGVSYTAAWLAANRRQWKHVH